jgi:hypothetical protein
MFEKIFFTYTKFGKEKSFYICKGCDSFFTYVQKNKMRPSYIFEFFKGICIHGHGHGQYAHTKFWQKKLILFKAIKRQNSDSSQIQNMKFLSPKIHGIWKQNF